MHASEFLAYKLEHDAIRPLAEPVDATLKSILWQFDAHSLEQQNVAALMDRIDTKYLLPFDALSELLPTLSDQYSVLQIASKRCFIYQNTYFDSPELNYFLQHHNGKLNRHKVRYRNYAETDGEFIEVKFKTNKRRTIKHRLSVDAANDEDYKGQAFTEQLLSKPEVARLDPVLHVNYRRVSFLHKRSKERLTLDFDLRFQRLGAQRRTRISNLVVAESKRAGSRQEAYFETWARTNGVRPSNFSKYCVGCCLTNHEGQLKTNRFKPILRKLDQFSITEEQL